MSCRAFIFSGARGTTLCSSKVFRSLSMRLLHDAEWLRPCRRRRITSKRWEYLVWASLSLKSSKAPWASFLSLWLALHLGCVSGYTWYVQECTVFVLLVGFEFDSN